MAAIVLAGSFLAWETGALALAHFYAETDPAAALRLRSDDPEALSHLADHLLVSQARSRDLAGAEALARRVLVVAPLQTGALRDLGLIASDDGHSARAAVIMTRAGMRGYRDIPTQSWLARYALRRGDFATALLRMDAMLRVEPDLYRGLFPVLLSLLNDPSARDAMSRRLATDPPWRPALLLYLSGQAKSPDQVIDLYQRLVRLGHAPTSDESTALLARMTTDGRFDQAYLLWVSFLPRRALESLGDLYDGNFQGLPGSPPFNWKFDQSPGVTAETANLGTLRGTALHVEYPVASSAQLAEQLLVLPVGSYRLSGRFMVTGPAAGAHLSWTLRCAGEAATLLAQTHQSADATSGWSPFSATLAVPAGCDAQWLRLEGSAGDEFGDLAVWYSHLAVQRVAAGTSTTAGADRQGMPSRAG